MFVNGLEPLFDRDHNVCVIGAGPVGIVTALELARQGQWVTLLESGEIGKNADAQHLSDALIAEGSPHAEMSLAVERSFGGTSNLWGAGCVPLDPIDFADRPFVADGGWPISYDDFAACIPDACRYANCGEPAFREGIPGLELTDSAFRTDSLFRFSQPASFYTAHRGEIARSPLISAHTDATATEWLFLDDGRVDGIVVRSRKGQHGVLRAKAFIIACGGVETARLLLTAQIGAPNRFGGATGPLGRYYMGHLSGEIADVRLDNPALDRGQDFYLDHGGRYARRRLIASAATQVGEQLTNVAFWPIMPPFRDPAHRSGILSLAYLTLAFPPTGRLLVSEYLRRIHVGNPQPIWPHLRNILLDLPSATAFAPRFLYHRFAASTRLPGFHLTNKGRRYKLHYHAEHLPNAHSRVTLADERDALSMPRARVDLRYAHADAEPILRSHEHLGRWLAATGLGELQWTSVAEDRLASILNQAGDGVHQIGTTRMAETARRGVVDRNCRMFGANNLFVAGSAVFPTSGQANPTFSALVLAIRLARFVARELPNRTVESRRDLILAR